MEEIIILLIIYAGIHFIYEAIYLPSIRLELRYKLFETRDKLRKLKIEHGEEIDNNLFNYLDYSLNSSIKYLPHITIATVIQSKSFFDKEETLKNQIDNKIQQIKDSNIPEIQQIFAENIETSFKALLANSGGWILTFLPLVILFLLILLVAQLANQVTEKIKKIIQEFSLTPDSKLSLFLHPNMG